MANKSHQRRRRDRRSTSRGTAVLELALCLPVLVLLFLATIDACNVLSLKQSLELAAYEGGRLAAMPSASTEQVVGTCAQFLAGRGVQNAEIEVSPPDVSDAEPGQLVRITISVSANDRCHVLDSGGAAYVVEGCFVTMKRMTPKPLTPHDALFSNRVSL